MNNTFASTKYFIRSICNKDNHILMRIFKLKYS